MLGPSVWDLSGPSAPSLPACSLALMLGNCENAEVFTGGELRCGKPQWGVFLNCSCQAFSSYKDPGVVLEVTVHEALV